MFGFGVGLRELDAGKILVLIGFQLPTTKAKSAGLSGAWTTAQGRSKRRGAGSIRLGRRWALSAPATAACTRASGSSLLMD